MQNFHKKKMHETKIHVFIQIGRNNLWIKLSKAESEWKRRAFLDDIDNVVYLWMQHINVTYGNAVCLRIPTVWFN